MKIGKAIATRSRTSASVMHCCLSHALLLEPMRSLTHGDVRKAFMKCVLRSRTLPTLIRLDRGVEFKNALMEELNALLGAEQRFSMALRPCEMVLLLVKVLGLVLSLLP